jgi:hypothetical protein
VGRKIGELARHVLVEVGEGRPVPWDAVDEIVDAVLDDELVRLALDVAEGGEHVVTRAVQLAAAVAVNANTMDTGDDDSGAEETKEEAS